MYSYWCYWEAPCSRYRGKAVVESLHEVKNGFWVDWEFIYTKNTEDAMYWIPPAGIRYVKRVEVANDGSN